MTEQVKIWLPNAEKTVFAGESLAETLSAVPLVIRLFGGIGAGKTTFLQGFAEGLGIHEQVQSPTFALEQRYRTEQFGELLHCDMHRLSQKDAQSFLASAASHPGICCIEWPERAGVWRPDCPFIDIVFDDADPRCRRLTVHFQTLSLQDRSRVWQWSTQFPTYAME